MIRPGAPMAEKRGTYQRPLQFLCHRGVTATILHVGRPRRVAIYFIAAHADKDWASGHFGTEPEGFDSPQAGCYPGAATRTGAGPSRIVVEPVHKAYF